ncbi:MAG: hypothetical protein ACYDHE_11555 [Candidatus Acidiferrales bacterium]
MRKMTAGFFKKNCLVVMDEVQAKRKTVVITKHGNVRSVLTLLRRAVL